MILYDGKENKNKKKNFLHEPAVELLCGIRQRHCNYCTGYLFTALH
jgi:hypothetical protein